MTRWILMSCLLMAALVVTTACGRLPTEGDPCSGPEDNICESRSGPGLYSCSSRTHYEYRRCSEICTSAGYDRWGGDCGVGSDGWDVCFCIR